MRLWETEKFTLNLKTGELIRSLSNMYIQGENFEHAHKRLLESEMNWLRLTGTWFLEKDMESGAAEGLQNNIPLVENDDENDDENDIDWSPSGFKMSDSLRDSLLNMEEERRRQMEENGEYDDDDDEDIELKPYKEPKKFTGYDERDWKDFLKAKTEFLGSLDLDQILDWLTTLEKAQVDDVWKTCIEYGLLERVKVVEGYLKYRYGKKN